MAKQKGPTRFKVGDQVSMTGPGGRTRVGTIEKVGVVNRYATKIAGGTFLVHEGDLKPNSLKVGSKVSREQDHQMKSPLINSRWRHTDPHVKVAQRDSVLAQREAQHSAKGDIKNNADYQYARFKGATHAEATQIAKGTYPRNRPIAAERSKGSGSGKGNPCHDPNNGEFC